MALAGFIKAGASVFSILVTAFALGSRHIFYGISFIDDFKKMGARFPYMIFSLSDEVYALYCNTDPIEGVDLGTFRFFSALLCQTYWVFGSILGAILGQVIPFDFKGIDFTMTALFVTVLIDQWRDNPDHRATIIGLVASILCLFIFGKSNFIFPALIISTLILFVIAKKEVTVHE